jgi:hypothetical protein
MNNQNIKIGVQIDSNTDKEATKAERLGAALKEAAATAPKIKVPAGGAATGVGSVMQKSQPVGAQAVMQYGAQRGTAGATGAAARDFARQSEGLGGLVRLYATYAANIYAVSAAFRALSTAMDTANMVRGLDQIGAASGVALGALSKELAKSTGNAISLREAMSATVKVTAAGLGSENVLRLGEVAAKASQALGVDMGDAINRLSRGITKLEPELLDELGIFTKIDPAVQKYALNVGKTASQLTDFERRQAFANAVLEEGEKKFAAIKVDANPYNKLAASLANIAQSGLELVNKVLAPIVNILSSSPSTLITILGGLGVSLLSKVIPALREIGTGSRRGADEALAALRETQVKAQAIRDQAAKVTKERIDAAIDSAVAKADKAEQKLKSLQNAAVSQTPEGVVLTSKKAQIDPNDPSVKNAVSAAYIRARELAAQGDKEGAKALRDLANATKEYGRDLNALQQQQDKTKLSNDKIIASNDKVAQSLETKAWKTNLVEQTKFNASVGGLGTALTILKSEIDKNEQGLNRWEKATTLVRGSLGALVGTLDKVAGAVGRIFFYIGIAVTVFESLKSALSYFSGNAKKVQEFNDTITTGDERIKNLSATIEEINKKPFAEQLNTQSVLARANAVNELAVSSEKLSSIFAETERSSGGLDKAIQNIKSLFGLSTRANDFSESLGKNIFAGLKNAGNSKQAKDAKQAISDVLKIEIDSSSEKQVVDAIKKIANNSGKIQDLNSAFKTLGTELNVSASRSKELETATEELNKAYKTFFDGLKSTDAFDVFAEKQKAAGLKLLASLTDPERALADLVKTINDPASAQLFDTETFTQLQNAKKELEELNEEQARNAALIENSRKEYSKALDAADKAQAKYANQPAFMSRASGVGLGAKPRGQGGSPEQAIPPEVAAANSRVVQVREDLTEAQRVLDESKASGVKAAQNFASVAVNAFERGANVTSAKIEAALSKGANIVKDNLIGFLGDLPGAAALRARSEQRQIAIQERLEQATLDQIRETRKNTLAVEKNNLIQQKRDIAADTLLDPKVQEKQIKSLNDRINTVTTLLDIINQNPRAAGQAIQAGTAGAKGILQSETATPEEKSTAAEQLKYFGDAQGFLERQSKLYGNINELSQKRLSIEDTKYIGILREQENSKQRIYNQELETNRVRLEELQTQESISGFLTKDQRDQRELLQIEALRLQQSKEFSQILSEDAQLAYTVGRLKTEVPKDGTENDKKMLAAAEEEIMKRRAGFSIKLAQNESRVNQQRLKNVQDRQRADKELVDFDTKSSAEIAKAIQEQNQIRLDAAEQELTRLSNIEGFNKLIIISEKAKLDTLKAQQQESQALYELDIKSVDLAVRKQQLADLGQLGINTQEASRRLEIETNQLEIQRNSIISKNVLQLASIEQAKQLAEQQERYNQTLLRSEQLSFAIKNAFEGLGGAVERIGVGFSNLIPILTNVGIQSDKNIKAEIAAREYLARAKKEEEEADREDYMSAALMARLKGEKALSDATQKRTKDELTGYAQIVGSAKKMFKEKSAGYKILGTVEKGLHLARLAMENKWLKTVLESVATELGIKITSGLKWLAAKVGFEANETALAEAGFLARSAILIKGIFLKVTEQLGWMGPPVAAAIIAAIGISALRKPAAFRPSKEQQVETQGTGTTFDREGRRVRREGGVFGDDTAKADSIRKGIDIIKENSTESLLIDNKALSALERLVLVLDKTAVSLYSIPGLIPTREEAVTTDNSGFGNLLGTKERTELKGSSLYFQGTLDDLAKGMEGTVSRVDEVNEQLKFRFAFINWYSSSRTSQRPGFVDQETRDLLAAGFSGVQDVVQAVGEQTGRKIDVSALTLLSEEPLSFKPGMTLEETQTEVNAYFSRELNLQFLKEYGDEFKKYTQGQEEYGETVVRVITTNRSLNESLQDLILVGGDFKNLGFEASEALAQSFGGTQAAISAFTAYNDSVFTDQQRLDSKRARLAQIMNSLGLQDIKTKTQYTAKIEQLTRDGQTNTETFKKLILLAPKFAEVVDELETKVGDAYDKLKQTRDSLKDILQGLRNFRDSLNKTIMSPGELYLKAKTEFERLAKDAADNSSATQQESARKIGEAGETFRAASSVMFASSDAYVADVRSITSIVDSLDEKFAGEMSDAQKALDEAVKQNASLADIKLNTENTYLQIKALYESIKQAEEGPASTNPATTDPSKLPPKPGSWEAITTGYYYTGMNNNPANIINSKNDFGSSSINPVAAGLASRNLLFSGVSIAPTAPAAAPEPDPVPWANYPSWQDWYAASQPVSGGATGSNYIMQDQMLYVHKGERLMPAADNRQLMKMVSDYSGGGNSELYDEVCRLTKQVEVLTQVVADGAILNAQATDRNTDQIATTIQTTGENTVYSHKLQNKVAVV